MCSTEKMPLLLCPNCFQRVAHNKYDTDIEHRCVSGKEVLDRESVFTMAEGTDFENTGDQQEVRRCAPMLQGIANRLQGTIGGIEGYDVEPRNVWGKRKSTHRSRKKFVLIDIPKR